MQVDGKTPHLCRTQSGRFFHPVFALVNGAVNGRVVSGEYVALGVQGNVANEIPPRREPVIQRLLPGVAAVGGAVNAGNGRAGKHIAVRVEGQRAGAAVQRAAAGFPKILLGMGGVGQERGQGEEAEAKDIFHGVRFGAKNDVCCAPRKYACLNLIRFT
ncbi:MAG: hypothetical protein IPH12_21445 [Saprospirales bacterium]|nr:hypothetical protein [Saprospirales bacterium]